MPYTMTQTVEVASGGEDCCCGDGVCCPDVPDDLFLTISGCNNPDLGDMDGTYPLERTGPNTWVVPDAPPVLPDPCFGTITFTCVDGIYSLAITVGTPETGTGPDAAAAISCEPFLWVGTKEFIPAGPPYEGNACCVGDTLTWTVSE